MWFGIPLTWFVAGVVFFGAFGWLANHVVNEKVGRVDENPEPSGKWRIQGRDTFSGELYPLEGEWDDQAQAELAAKKQLGALEVTQPSEDSGGQDDEGIQDQVWVIRPDGTEYRVWG